jgi:hypothetical protein
MALAYTENLAAGRCADTRMVLRALQQRWPILDEIRKFLPEWMAKVVKNENLSYRKRTTAAKILLEIEKFDLAGEELKSTWTSSGASSRIGLAELGKSPSSRTRMAGSRTNGAWCLTPRGYRPATS